MSIKDAKIWFLIVVGMVVVFFALVNIGDNAVDPQGTTKLLQSQGYTNIKITGYRAWVGGDDPYSTGFEATAPNGSHVTGAVTSGPLKGKTVRFDN